MANVLSTRTLNYYIQKYPEAGEALRKLYKELEKSEFNNFNAVSYTHLDVYKRQGRSRCRGQPQRQQRHRHRGQAQAHHSFDHACDYKDGCNTQPPTRIRHAPPP